jgi:Ca2+-binding RTX toxin-like protein
LTCTGAAALDALEPRRLLSGTVIYTNGTLTVAGSSGGNVIALASTSSGVSVTLDGVKSGPFAGVTKIVLNGNDGNDSVAVGAGVISCSINGGNGNDTLTGGGGNDTVIGGAGADRLNGAGGNDLFPADATPDGADDVIGGAGRDTVSYASRTAGVRVYADDLANDGHLLPGTSNTDESDNVHRDVENITGSQAGDDLRGAESVANAIDGQGGADYLRTSLSDADTAATTVGVGADTLTGGAGDDFIEAIRSRGQHKLLGGDGNDRIRGGFGKDEVSGGGGNDLLDYAYRTSSLTISLDNVANDGQAGELDNVKSDVEQVTTGNGNDRVTGSSAANSLNGGNGNDTLDGAGGNDTLAGGAADDSLMGGDGNDTFPCGSATDGADQIIGGGGRDTVDYSARTVGVLVYTDGINNDGNHIAGTAVTDEHDNVAADVENLIGSATGDDLRGSQNVANVIDGRGGDDYVRTSLNDPDVMAHRTDGGADTLIGGAGDDYLDAIFSRANHQFTGGDGNDLMRVGYGVDVVDGGNGTDTVSYNYRGIRSAGNSFGNVTLSLDGVANDGETGEGDNVLTNVENAVTGSGHDTITGSSADNLFISGAGNDSVSGGAGNDTFVNRHGDSATSTEPDADTIDGGSGVDFYQGDTRDTTRNVDRNYDPDPNAPQAVPPAAAPASIAAAPPPPSLSGRVLTVTGDDAANTIAINQTATAVTVTVGSAAPRSFAAADLDRIDVNALGGNDVVTVTGSGKKTTRLNGGAGNDRLTGGAGSDIFYCGASKDGNDTMVGGGGTDRADYADRAGPLIVSSDNAANDGEFSTGERDNVSMDIEYVFGGRGGDVIESVRSTLAVGYVLFGGAGNDRLTGGMGMDQLIGAAGSDTVSGGAGFDILTLNDGQADRYRLEGSDLLSGDSLDQKF